MVPMLVAINGPVRGTLFRLTDEEIAIGRHSSNQLSITDLPVSRRHCVIRRSNDTFSIFDLDSNNGTFVNGVRISEHVLADGDDIGVGNSIFKFVAHDSPERIEIGVARDTGAKPKSTVRLRIEELFQEPQAPQAEGPPERLALIQVLTQIGNIINSGGTAGALEAQLLKVACEAIPAEHGALVLARRIGDEAVSIFGWNRDSGPCSKPQLTNDIIETTFSGCESILCNEFLPGVGSSLTSALGVPLRVGGKIQGVIYLDTTHPTRRFCVDDLELVTALSSYLALALDHSQRMRDLAAESRRLLADVRIQHDMVGQSPIMKKTYERIARIAPTDATVLIGGEKHGRNSPLTPSIATVRARASPLKPSTARY